MSVNGNGPAETQKIRNSETGLSAAMPLSPSALEKRVIGAAIEVHRTLGPGFLESFYETALVAELGFQGLKCARQMPVPVAYKGVPLGSHRLDVLVEARLLLELKCVRSLEPVHFTIVRSYMAATLVQQALILNFARMPLEIRRVYPDRSASRRF